MAKKYKQDYKDHYDEHMGMERKMKKGSSSRGFVTGNDPSIGRRDHAGLPQEKVMEQYPPCPYGKGGMLNDSMSGIDDVLRSGHNKASENVSYQK